MKKTIKYSSNRSYRDFVDEEIQEEIVKNIKQNKLSGFIKKGIGKIFSFLNNNR